MRHKYFDLTMSLAEWETTVFCEVRGLIARRVKARVTTGGGASMSAILGRRVLFVGIKFDFFKLSRLMRTRSLG